MTTTKTGAVLWLRALWQCLIALLDACGLLRRSTSRLDPPPAEPQTADLHSPPAAAPPSQHRAAPSRAGPSRAAPEGYLLAHTADSFARAARARLTPLGSTGLNDLADAPLRALGRAVLERRSRRDRTEPPAGDGEDRDPAAAI